MTSIRHILCPVDVMNGSHEAVEQAATLASLNGARLLLLYVFTAPLPLRRALPQPVSEVLTDKARAALLRDLDAVAAPVRARGLTVDTVVREGEIVPEILAAIQAGAADLVVMATHGRSGLGRLILGSVTERTIRSAPCPVLSVSPRGEGVGGNEPTAPYRHILCAVDFSSESLSALAFATALAEQVGGTVRLLHVVEWFNDTPLTDYGLFDVPEYPGKACVEAQAELRAVAPRVTRARLDLLDVVIARRPYEEILRQAASHPTDLIALGVRGRGALDMLISGSTTNHVLREAPCPVLTVHATRDPHVGSST
jgi:nucleotide-binding universal stress UspA family protein